MTFEPTSRNAPNKVMRYPQRGSYDEETVFSAVDRAGVCHATFKLPGEEHEDDWPVIIPMVFGRKDHTIYLHGHLSSRLLKAMSEDQVRACLAFTTVTGLIVSFAPFLNDNNYECAILFGYPRLIDDEKEKIEALKCLTNHAFRAPDGSEGDRWADSRETKQSEYTSTRVIAFEIEMASAKIRTGGPKDEATDIQSLTKKHWTGTLHKEEKFTKAEPSPYNEAPLPDYIQRMLS